MDESVGNEMNAIDATVDDTLVRNKENEYSLRPGSSNMLESEEMVTPCEGNDHCDGSTDFFTEYLESNNFDRIGSSVHASASPRCNDSADVMVEELTIKNYDGKNLAIVGTSNSRDRMHIRQNQWQHLYQIAGGSGITHRRAAYGEKVLEASGNLDNLGQEFFPGLSGHNQKAPEGGHHEVVDNFLANDDKAISNEALFSLGGIRTKILSKSGFSEYFIKSTLKGKGVTCKGAVTTGSVAESHDHIRPRPLTSGLVKTSGPLSLNFETVTPPHGISGRLSGPRPDAYKDGIILREWLKAGPHKLSKVEILSMFKQILDLVDIAHSQGDALQDFRPSYFKLLPSKHVVYLGSSARVNSTENFTDQDVPQSVLEHYEKRPIEESMLTRVTHGYKKRKLGEDVNLSRWPQLPSRSCLKSSSISVTERDIAWQQEPRGEFSKELNSKTEYSGQCKSSSSHPSCTSKLLSTSVTCLLEEKWYTSPEQSSDKASTFASNIYCLGVLLFELLGSFDDARSRAAAMLDLHHRILPPSFLSENPKEAGFCLWLLHPEPSSRPTTREILLSEIVSGIPELSKDEFASSIDEEGAESELLLYFMLHLKEQKQKDASKLIEDLKCIEADIQEVERRQMKISALLPSKSSAAENRFLQSGQSRTDVYPLLPNECDNEMRLMKNIKQLESAYFSMRSNIQLCDNDAARYRSGEILKYRENWHIKGKDERNKSADRLGGFFGGLCKYARYSKFKVRGMLRNGDFNTSANVICSLSFDRDEDYLAAGGVSKKIKIFEFNALFNDSVDIHYPVLEMPNKSKLSCISWNSYIRNYLASTDYDGVVKLWDAATGQGFSQFAEHSERAWSVDFSRIDPTKLASGSDDRLVKLWSINERNSLCTIINKANVCCVQFSPDSAHMLAFSSADYKTYCYDLRNVSTPWCTLAGHEKAVSYAKFLDAETLISASTDNTLKIWDLNKTNCSGLSNNACTLTLRGHTNEKNFVGLSVADGYIACGSETNEVFAYYRSLPMPITSHKFGSIDPISGKETDDDNGQFVSSVCWRRKSNMVIAANSTGSIKLLQMV